MTMSANRRALGQPRASHAATRASVSVFAVGVLLLTVLLPEAARAQTATSASTSRLRYLPRHERGDTAIRGGPDVLRVRPFITDDARVVGARLGQIESWLRADREAEQLWVLGAYGPNDRVELTVGGVIGAERHSDGREDSYALPLLQGKFLIRPYETGAGPGFAFVAGTFLPHGRGAFVPAGYGTFAFAIATQAWGEAERVLVHVNVGTNYLGARVGDGATRRIEHQTVATWGTGTQIRVAGGSHIVAELFSGDPYVPGSGTAWQAGVRHFVSERLQVDATVGDGIAGATPLTPWISAGIRVVLP